MNWEDITKRVEKYWDGFIDHIPKVLLAVAILYIGIKLVNFLLRKYDRYYAKTKLAQELKSFFRSLIHLTLLAIIVLVAAQVVGIQTTSFVLILSAVGFSIGMALQGSLGNLASGVMILIFKPYKVGDFIEMQDQMGKVEEIEIFNTIITTFDNRTVIVPNGIAISDIITNLSKRKYLRVDLSVHIPYETSFSKVKALLERALLEVPKVLSDPKPFVGIENYDSHNIELAVRPYCMVDDYWDVYYACNEAIKQTLAQNAIKVAYSEGVELGDITE